MKQKLFSLLLAAAIALPLAGCGNLISIFIINSQLDQHHLLKMPFFSHCIVLASLSKIKWADRGHRPL